MKTIKSLYEHTVDIHNTRAAEIIVPLLLQYVKPDSVLDVGCGLGTWLKVIKDLGANDILGVDGEYVNRSMLQIGDGNFLAHDLCKPFDLNKEFDLVVSLEVAEHLPESASDVFVKTLVKHGKAILFSAAIPGQGGQNHLNEQWPKYWQEKFLAHGYHYYDLIRPQIWNDTKVERWYKQNIFLLFHESLEVDFEPYNGGNLIHPEYWVEVHKLRKSLYQWQNGRVGAKRILKAFLFSIYNKSFNTKSMNSEKI